VAFAFFVVKNVFREAVSTPRGAISEPCIPILQHFNTPSLQLSLPFDIYRTAWKNISPIHLFSSGITGILRRTVGGASGFEERRTGERYKLALPVQLSDGTITGKQLQLL
jgi:hypothetical protein